MSDPNKYPAQQDLKHEAETPLSSKLNSYLHTKSEIKIGNPAIIWHRAYWKPQEIGDEAWHKAVASALVRTHRRTMSKFLTLLKKTAEYDARSANDPYLFQPTIGDLERRNSIEIEFDYLKKLGSIKPGESYSINAMFKGINVTISFEMYEEFWSKKMVLDYSSFEYGCKEYPERLTEETSIELLGRSLGFLTWDMNAAYQTLAAKRIASKGPVPFDRRSRIYPSKMQKLSLQMSQCLHDIDKEFYPEVKSSASLGNKDLIHAPSLRFADFIGHSLGLPSTPMAKKTLKNMCEFGRPFPLRSPKGVAARLDRGAIFEDDCLDDIIEASWGAITEVNPVVSRTGDRPPDGTKPESNIREFSLTLIDRCRALYVSSLGRAGASKASTDTEVYQPLAYLVLSPHQARWQIGRVIDTLHNLGMYRLASMHQYDELAKCQDELRLLQDDAAKSIHGDGRIKAIQKKFSDLVQDRNPSGPDKKCAPWPAGYQPAPVSGGLRYRLDWSESYLRTYWRLVESLETSRIEGHQQYRDFIERNLSDNFENINLVRSRVDYLDNFIASRFYTNNQEEMKDLQGGIQNVLKKAELFSKLVFVLTIFAVIPAMVLVGEGVNPILLAGLSMLEIEPLPTTVKQVVAISSVILGTVLTVRYRKTLLSSNEGEEVNSDKTADGETNTMTVADKSDA